MNIDALYCGDCLTWLQTIKPGSVDLVYLDPPFFTQRVQFSQYTTDRAPGALDETIALLADGRLRLRAHKTMPMQQAAEAHRQLESGTVHERNILTLQQRGWPGRPRCWRVRMLRRSPLASLTRSLLLRDP